jgi:two-component system, NarL family, nitrate/nitrite response regulator NarL
MSENISMVIVDDHPFFREGVATILGNQPDIDVVGQGGTAQEALDLARDLLPDVLLLDIDIPGGGLQAAQHIARTCPIVKIVMLTVSADEEHVLSAFKAGAHAYVLKGVATQELIHILHTVYAGEGYVTPTLAASLLSEMSSASPGERARAVSFDELTERERQILELVAQGNSNREIGQKLYLTEKTVKHYVTNLLQKLHVRNRVEAAVLAQRGVRQDQGTR